MNTIPFKTHEMGSSVDYHFRLDYPQGDLRLPKLFDTVRTGVRDGRNTVHHFPKGLTEAVVVFLQTSMDPCRDDFALCCYETFPR